MSESLTGTPRGAQRCGGCGHARRRHLVGGSGPCGDVTYPPADPDRPEAGYRVAPCLCPLFTEPTESE